MRREDCVRELDFVAARDVWHRNGGRIVPSSIDFRAFRLLPIVLFNHDWRQDIGRVTALRITQIDGVETLTGTMRVVGAGRHAALDALAAPLLAGRAGPSIAVQWKPGPRGVGGTSWLEEISLTDTPAMPGAVITALHLNEWRI